MKKANLTDVAALVIWLLPIIYFIKIYANLPQTIALHFGLDGKPNRFGDKTELLWTMPLLSIVTFGIYFLIKYLPKIDPKKTAGYSAETFKKISFALVIFLSGLQVFIINSSVTGYFGLDKLFLPFMGLFFAYLGNLMHSIKSNYFVGIRTPWTLEDPDTWRATHQLGGKMWFIGGIIITISTLLLPPKIGFIFFITIIVIISLVPVIYSYIYFKEHKQ
ncbi:MAG: SdpI family protein [Bacteroidota bacterium]|nr:SdpI family protein [Bacteroidota bacterium]